MADLFTTGWWQGSFPISGYTFNNPAGHLGTDFGLPSGTAITAGMAGTVNSGYNSQGGNWITVTGNGISVYLGHLSKILVGSGVVPAGTLLGYSGATGDAQGSHLHFQVAQNGNAVDPVKWLGANPGALAGRGGGRAGQTVGGTTSSGANDPFGFVSAANNVMDSVKTDTVNFAKASGSAVAFIAIALILLVVGGIAIIIGPAKKVAETAAPVAAAAVK